MKTNQIKSLLNKYGININNIKMNDKIAIQMKAKIDSVDDILYFIFNELLEENKSIAAENIEKNPEILYKNFKTIKANVNFLYQIDEFFTLDELVDNLSILSANNKYFKESVRYITNKYDFETFLENPLLAIIPTQLLLKIEEAFEEYDLPITKTCEVCLFGQGNLIENFDKNVVKAKFAIDNNITLNARLYYYSFDKIKLFQEHRNYGEVQFYPETSLAYVKYDKVREVLREKGMVTQKMQRPFLIHGEKKRMRAVPLFSNGDKKYQGDIPIDEGKFGKLRTYFSFDVSEGDITKAKFDTEYNDPNDIEDIRVKGYFNNLNTHLNENKDKYTDAIKKYL